MTDLIAKGKFPPPVDRDAVARDWNARGYGCDPFTDPPGREWRDFRHPTNELVTVVEGRLELTIGGETLIAEEGDEVYIPKDWVHSVKNIHDRTTHWLYGYD